VQSHLEVCTNNWQHWQIISLIIIIIFIQNARISAILIVRGALLVGVLVLHSYSVITELTNRQEYPRAVFIWVSNNNWFCINYATWLALKTWITFLSNQKSNPNQSCPQFSMLYGSNMKLLWVSIGSLYWLCPLWLVRVIREQMWHGVNALCQKIIKNYIEIL